MEALAYPMSAYLHQDWNLDGGTASDTVTQFMSERGEVTRACADQIDELLGQQLAEGKLAAWGCAYRAGDSDDDYRRWLLEVRDQIRSSAA